MALAVSAGAAQLAMGRDLGRDLGQSSGRSFSADFAAATSGLAVDPTAATGTSVNRAAKSDRGAIQQTLSIPTRTFSIRPGHLVDTSVLVRIPAAKNEQAQDVVPAQPAMIQPGATAPKRATACELAVSVLVAGARHLPPGRCLA